MTFDMDQLLALLVIAAAVGVAATTFTQSALLEPVRVRIHETSWVPAWVSNFMECSYCVTHWLAIIAVVVYQPLPVQSVWLLDFVVSTGVMVMAASLMSGLLYKLYE